MVKTLRNQKGITLIELLAVIVIIGIVAAIAVPAIGKTIENSKTSADNASVSLIKESAIRYALDGSGTFNGNTFTITIKALADAGYLNAVPTFQKLGYNDNTVVTVTKSDNGSVAATLPTLTTP